MKKGDGMTKQDVKIWVERRINAEVKVTFDSQKYAITVYLHVSEIPFFREMEDFEKELKSMMPCEMGLIIGWWKQIKKSRY